MFRIFLSLSFVLLLSTAAMAQTTTESYNTTNSMHKQVLVSGLKDLPDKSKVMLTGMVTKQDNEKKYEFTDASGRVVLELKDDMWRNMQVDFRDEVRVYGELDKSIIGMDKIEVENVVKVTPRGAMNPTGTNMHNQTTTVSTTSGK